MKRLTKRYASHIAVVCDNCEEKGSYCDTSVCCDVMRNRLAEYEDTGLEPKEINEKMNEAYDLGAQSVLRYKGLTWSEAEELLRHREAEEQGLLVRHGRWEPTMTSKTVSFYLAPGWKCSCCGHEIEDKSEKLHYPKHLKYCWNCGAKMEKQKEKPDDSD